VEDTSPAANNGRADERGEGFSMSTTNGAGEPSMEEILASIRNIIAQEPPSEKASDETSSDDSAPVLSMKPSNSSYSASPTLSPASPGAPAAAGAFGHRPGQRQDLRPQEYGAGSFGLSATPGDVRYSPGPAAALKPSADSGSAADDFSDVFDEPLQKLPVTPSPPVKTESGGDAGSMLREPKLPDGTNGTTRHNRHPADIGPRGDTSVVHRVETASPPRREFDFGTLRPPRKDEAAPVTVASEVIGPAKTGLANESAAPHSDGSAQSLSETGEGPSIADKSGEPPRRQVVIAAMPSKPETSRADFASALAGAEKSELEADAPTNANHSVEAPPSPSSDGDVGLKTANVGFLAATPRPSDSSVTRSSDTGQSFFDAVSGAALDKTEWTEGRLVERESDEPASLGGADDLAAVSAPAEPVGAATEPTQPVDEPAAVEPKAAAAGAGTGGPQTLAQGLSVANIVVSSDGGKVRTLEDTVAELLRPLLREWLENNMPRIVESALRLEVADSVKKQLDSPPSKANGIGS